MGKPGVKVLIPVKANAYGCGLNAILPFLKEADIDMLGVANLREAQEIRRSGFKKSVLLLGSFYKKNVSVIFQENITPLITDLWQIEFLEKEAKARGSYLDIHVKWDLGMGRLGLLPDQEKLFLTHFSKTSSLKIKGMMTHFPGPGRKASLKQLARFMSLAERVIRAASLDREDVILHSANSYALLNYPESALDMIRPGLIFYGYFQNFKDYKKLSPKFPIRPSLRLTSKPFSQRILKKGCSGILWLSVHRERKKLSGCRSTHWLRRWDSRGSFQSIFFFRLPPVGPGNHGPDHFRKPYKHGANDRTPGRKFASFGVLGKTSGNHYL